MCLWRLGRRLGRCWLLLEPDNCHVGHKDEQRPTGGTLLSNCTVP